MSTERAPRVRIQRRPVHGVLLLDKPLGFSSNDALQKAKWLLRAEKAGHTGTLDPMATGLLPLCFGAATKFSQVSLDADKAYVAHLQLGVRTTTGDREGEVLESRDVSVTAQQVQDAVGRFIGEIDQVPPMHSALKKDGKPLYVYARQGIEVDRPARRVTVHDIRAEWDPTAPQHVVLHVRCSKGTYIRTLGEDIGEALGCGASLTALRRTGSGGLSVDRAVSLAELEAMPEPARLALLHPVDALLQQWPSVVLPQDEAGRFLTGLRRRLHNPLLTDDERELPAGTPVRVYGPPVGQPILLGSAHVTAGELIPDRLLSPLEIESQFAAVAP